MPPLAPLLRNQLALLRLPSTSRPVFTSPPPTLRKLPLSLPTTRPFSSTPPARDASQPTPLPKTPPKAEPGKQNTNPSFESAGFGQMWRGSSRGVKIVLIAGFCIVATAETVTWTLWGWDYVKGWFGSGDDVKGREGD